MYMQCDYIRDDQANLEALPSLPSIPADLTVFILSMECVGALLICLHPTNHLRRVGHAAAMLIVQPPRQGTE